VPQQRRSRNSSPDQTTRWGAGSAARLGLFACVLFTCSEPRSEAVGEGESDAASGSEAVGTMVDAEVVDRPVSPGAPDVPPVTVPPPVPDAGIVGDPGTCLGPDRRLCGGQCYALPELPKEICDGADNDCNGSIDDGALCTDAPRGGQGTCSLGRCQYSCPDGLIDCKGSCWQCCVPSDCKNPGTQEVTCNAGTCVLGCPAGQLTCSMGGANTGCQRTEWTFETGAEGAVLRDDSGQETAPALSTTRAHGGTRSAKLTIEPNHGGYIAAVFCGGKQAVVSVKGRGVSAWIFIERDAPVAGIVSLVVGGWDAVSTYRILEMKIEDPPVGQWIQLSRAFEDNGTEGAEIYAGLFVFSGNPGGATTIYVDDLRFD
jgi:hypothetical protein